MKSILAKLGAALAERYRALVAPAACKHCRLLDAQLADHDEMVTRTGYGALLASAYKRPIRVWSRMFA